MPDESNPRKEGLVLVYVFRVAVHGSRRNVTPGVKSGWLYHFMVRKKEILAFIQ